MDPLEAFLLTWVPAHPHDLDRYAAQELRLPLPEVRGRIRELVRADVLEEVERSGRTEWRWKPVFHGAVVPGMEEDAIWRKFVDPRLTGLPANVIRLLHYGFTETLNNVIDHAGAETVVVQVRHVAALPGCPASLEIYVEDDGVGIFAKLQRELGLEDPRHVALELSKGKLTTDPARHTGEGIFFTARMCDAYLIWSGTTVCGHADGGAWHVRTGEERRGTTVRMMVRLDTRRTTREIFDEFAPPSAELAFTRTEIEADLARHPGEELVSRSQAKRLLARCERFRRLLLDFRGVDSIGPAFADEVFRVFPAQHPGLVIEHRNASPEVQRMIERARRTAGDAPA